MDTNQLRSWYRFDETNPESKAGFLPVKDYNEACEWNEKKWGIFWTVNEFEGSRKKENLKKILSWAVDIDTGTKEAQRSIINKYLTPSQVIETPRGYHVYYDSIDGTAEGWDDIVAKRLIYCLGGDPRAKDISRVLRVPATLHWKDPENPFGIKLVAHSNAAYTEEEMRRVFKKEPTEAQQKSTLKKELKFQKDGQLFERIYSMDCEDALKRLSGSPAVSMESYSFKDNHSGTKNIIVNGKSSSCWIDLNKKIGSLDGGGPTVWQWINWLHRNHKKTFRYFSDSFPEVVDVR